MESHLKQSNLIRDIGIIVGICKIWMFKSFETITAVKDEIVHGSQASKRVVFGEAN